MILQADFIRSSKSKYIIFLIYFAFLASSALAQTGVINNGAKMIVNTGAVLKITGTGADYTNTTAGGNDGRIVLDGKIIIDGDWSNNAASGTVFQSFNKTGTVLFNGSLLQDIGGTASTQFENLVLDNSSGLSLSAGNVIIHDTLTLLNGLIHLNSSNLFIELGGGILGAFGPTKMIATNGTGSLRKAFNSGASFTFPIGDTTGVVEYTPVDFDLAGNGGVNSGCWVGASVVDGIHPEGTGTSEYLTRYWRLESSGIISPVFNAGFYYQDADIQGTETAIYAVEYDDGLNRSVYSTVNAGSNMLAVTGMSAIENTYADYTGEDGTAPTVSISSTEPSPTNAGPIPITITFSEEVTGFTYTDITIDNGSTSSVSTLDNIVFTFDVTPVKDSIVTIGVNAGVAKDIAGNDNIAATTYRIEYDGTSPGVSNLYPENNQSDVPLADNLQMTFDEVVYLKSGNIEIRKAAGGVLVESIDVTTLDGNGTKTITIDPASNFENQVGYYVLVPSGAFTDAAGNEYAGIIGTSDWAFSAIDVNKPYISSVSPVDESPDVIITSDLVITFSENVNAVAGKYITIRNASTSSIHQTIEASNTNLVTVTNNVATINPNDFDGETDYYVIIDAGAFEDMESNPFAGILSSVYWNFTTEDISAPTVTVTSTEPGPTNVSPFEITIKFSEEVTGFEIGDITVGNGTASNLNTSDNITYTASITPTSDGLVTVDIAANAAIDAAGNGNIAATQFSMAYDSVVPTVTITSTEPDPTFSSDFDITITFSEEVVGFELSDIIVSNGTVGNLNTNDNTVFTAAITPALVGSVTVDIFAGIAFDLAGNANTQATQFSIEFNGVKPDVTVSTIESDTTNVSPIIFDIVFTVKVTGFELSDIVVSNASTSNLETSDSVSFTVNITPASEGLVSVSVPAGVAETAISNTNNASNTANITYDTTPPVVSITTAESGAVTGNFDITITFSEKVTGFTTDDIIVVNGTVNNFIESTAGQIWAVTIAPGTGGDVTVDINSGIAQDAAGNYNSTAEQFSIYYDSSVGFEDIIPYEISIYSVEKKVIVEFTNKGNYQFNHGAIEVYNLLGQKIVDKTINNFDRFETEVKHGSQIYIVKAIIDGSEYAKRLFIE